MFPLAPSALVLLFAMIPSVSDGTGAGVVVQTESAAALANVPVLTGTVDGYVRSIVGITSHPAIGATVTLTDALGHQVNAVTNAQGYFRVVAPAGVYTSSARLGALQGVSYGVRIAPPLATTARVNINIR